MLGICLAAAIWPLAAGRADEPADQLRAVEQRLESGKARTRALAEEAKELGAELERLRSQSIEIAANVQRREAEATRLEAELAVLHGEREEKSALLAARRGELAVSIGALARLGGQPAEVMIASPGGAIEAVRSSILLGAMVPALGQRIDDIGAEVVRLAAIEADIARRRSAHEAALEALRGQRDELGSLLARTAELRHSTERDRRREAERVARLATEAETIRALIERLEWERQDRLRRERRDAMARAEAAARAAAESRIRDLSHEAAPAPDSAHAALSGESAKEEGAADAAEAQRQAEPTRLAMLPPGRRSFAEARGTLPLPLRGRIIERFGQLTERGTRAKGLTVEARARAQVIAPYDGRIAFAGPYRGYGQLLIIEHGDGYHTLLAGLSRIDGSVGQWLLAGEPVGQMGQESDEKPTLYIEIRRNGQPINPLPWLAAEERRVSG